MLRKCCTPENTSTVSDQLLVKSTQAVNQMFCVAIHLLASVFSRVEIVSPNTIVKTCSFDLSWPDECLWIICYISRIRNWSELSNKLFAGVFVFASNGSTKMGHGDPLPPRPFISVVTSPQDDNNWDWPWRMQTAWRRHKSVYFGNPSRTKLLTRWTLIVRWWTFNKLARWQKCASQYNQGTYLHVYPKYPLQMFALTQPRSRFVIVLLNTFNK